MEKQKEKIPPNFITQMKALSFFQMLFHFMNQYNEG